MKKDGMLTAIVILGMILAGCMADDRPKETVVFEKPVEVIETPAEIVSEYPLITTEDLKEPVEEEALDKGEQEAEPPEEETEEPLPEPEEEQVEEPIAEEPAEEIIEEEIEEGIEMVDAEEEEAGMIYLGAFDLTAYCWTGYPCANGNYPATEYTVACNSLPLGTTVYIEGIGYRVVEDRGAEWHADNWMDLYLGDEASCWEWGVRTRDVWVVE